MRRFLRSLIKFVSLISFTIICTSQSIKGQNADFFDGITDAGLMNYYKENGIKYSIEGIWLIDAVNSAKIYEGSVLMLDIPSSNNNIKMAYIRNMDKILILNYDSELSKYNLNKEWFIKPTTVSTIYQITIPAVRNESEGSTQKEFNGKVFVKENTISYDRNIEFIYDNKPKKLLVDSKYFGIKVAPTENDLLISSQPGNKIVIPIKQDGGMHYVILEIGGQSQNYMIDSGSSYISITPAIEEHLKAIGVLRDSDYRGEVDLELADNSIQKAKKVVLPAIKIGNQNITNVEAIVSGGSLLLGRSLISKFKSWNIDNSKSILSLELY